MRGIFLTVKFTSPSDVLYNFFIGYLNRNLDGLLSPSPYEDKSGLCAPYVFAVLRSELQHPLNHTRSRYSLISRVRTPHTCQDKEGNLDKLAGGEALPVKSCCLVE